MSISSMLLNRQKTDRAGLLQQIKRQAERLEQLNAANEQLGAECKTLRKTVEWQNGEIARLSKAKSDADVTVSLMQAGAIKRTSFMGKIKRYFWR